MTRDPLIVFPLQLSILVGFAVGCVSIAGQAQTAEARAINGVYNGTYTCMQGPRTLKLSLTVSSSEALAGEFTFYLPPTSHDRAFSYSLHGTWDAATGKFRLAPVKWETAPPPGYSMVGVDGTFNSGSGQVSGKVISGSCFGFQATRDQSESAGMNRGSAAPQRAQAITQPAVASGTRPAPQPAQIASSAAQSPATLITGVYKGSYNCESGNLNLKLALTGRADGTVSGFIIFDLPPYLGSHATYKVAGRYAYGVSQFRLDPVPVGLAPPRDYAMGQMNGSYGIGSSIIRGATVSRACTDFHAQRDKSETPEAVALEVEKDLAAPRAPVPVPVPANFAPPTSMPPKGLVRKSRKFWDEYDTDVVRQVFDGNFGEALDPSPAFELVFNSYVELYSKDCRDLLPAKHSSLMLSNPTQGQSVTVEMDPRFEAKYLQYGKAIISGGQTLRAVLAVESGRSNPLAPGFDVDRFFKEATCQSASMHQLGENLIRAATGKRSLQEDGVSIPGAAEESEKPLSPGRYACFVDGCVAYYRAPHPGKSYGEHEIHWCGCLSAQYERQMTHDEQVHYGNDFEELFLGGIAQPWGMGKSKSDPAYPRLHPAVDKCRQ